MYTICIHDVHYIHTLCTICLHYLHYMIYTLHYVHSRVYNTMYTLETLHIITFPHVTCSTGLTDSLNSCSLSVFTFPTLTTSFCGRPGFPLLKPRGKTGFVPSPVRSVVRSFDWVYNPICSLHVIYPLNNVISSTYLLKQHDGQVKNPPYCGWKCKITYYMYEHNIYAFDN